MSKKIIALALAILFIATAFTACKQKYETIEIDGKEYALATDVNGNTIVNDKYQIAVLVTDDKGKIVTDVNGESMTDIANVWGDALKDGKTYSELAGFVIPEGWEPAEDGSLVKTGTEGNCYIKCIKAADVDEENTFETYLALLDDQNNQIVEGMEEQGFTVETNASTGTVDGISAQYYSYKVLAKDGSVVHYAENYYFVELGTIYKIEYACLDGVGYDSSFDFRAYVSNNGVEFISPNSDSE